MEQRLTLVSDPTDEFAQNKNNHFKVRIPDGLHLVGEGWYVTLLSLTLLNSDGQRVPFNFGHGKKVARIDYKILHMKGPLNKPLDTSTLYNASRDVLGTKVTNVTNGLAFWNKVIHLMNEDVISNSYRMRKTLVDVTDPTPAVYVKESMCPSFRWEGEDLIVKRRGTDATDGRQKKDNTLYSCFDIAYEVALQWGFIRVKSDGTIMVGPNLRMTLFQDEITAHHPQRVVKTYLRGVSNLHGKAIEPQGNLDIPRGNNVPSSGATVYDLMWYYTVGSEKWIRLSGSVEWRLTKLNATYDAIHKHTGKAVMVYTNLQQSTVVGSTKAQLLRQLVVRRGGDAGHSYSEPKHLQWIPVSTRQTDIVEVQLADVNGTLLDLPQGKNLVTVALKQML